MSNQSPLTIVVSPAEIVERITASLKAKGLEKTQEDYDGMEHLLSGLPWWSMVKSEADILFADERKRLEELELARAKATAPNVYQFMPSATAGIDMDVDVKSPGNTIARTIKIERKDEDRHGER